MGAEFWPGKKYGAKCNPSVALDLNPFTGWFLCWEGGWWVPGRILMISIPLSKNRAWALLKVGWRLGWFVFFLFCVHVGWIHSSNYGRRLVWKLMDEIHFPDMYFVLKNRYLDIIYFEWLWLIEYGISENSNANIQSFQKLQLNSFASFSAPSSCLKIVISPALNPHRLPITGCTFVSRCALIKCLNSPKSSAHWSMGLAWPGSTVAFCRT